MAHANEHLRRRARAPHGRPRRRRAPACPRRPRQPRRTSATCAAARRGPRRSWPRRSTSTSARAAGSPRCPPRRGAGLACPMIAAIELGRRAAASDVGDATCERDRSLAVDDFAIAYLSTGGFGCCRVSASTGLRLARPARFPRDPRAAPPSARVRRMAIAARRDAAHRRRDGVAGNAYLRTAEQPARRWLTPSLPRGASRRAPGSCLRPGSTARPLTCLARRRRPPRRRRAPLSRRPRVAGRASCPRLGDGRGARAAAGYRRRLAPPAAAGLPGAPHVRPTSPKARVQHRDDAGVAR